MDPSGRIEAAVPRPIGGTYTFGGRKGRMSATRQAAIDDLVPRYLATTPFTTVDRPLIVEIGCGKGEATAAMAAGDAGSTVIACEANEATIAQLALLLDEQMVDNVRLWVGDAFALLEQLGPQAVTELRIWFPDPWPKPRQARKRLLTRERFDRIVGAIAVGGRLRLATDDPAYAAETLAAIGRDGRLQGGVVARPPERPITKFEGRGLRQGRPAVDIEAVRTT